MNVGRALKHIAVFLVSASVALPVGYGGVMMSLSTFAPGGDVEFADRQRRRATTGEAILAVYDWPSQYLLGVQRSWTFSSGWYGAVLYGTLAGLHQWRRTVAIARLTRSAIFRRSYDG